MSARTKYYANRSRLRRDIRAMEKSAADSPRSSEIGYSPGEVERLRVQIAEAKAALRATEGKHDPWAMLDRQRFQRRLAEAKRRMVQRRAERERAVRVASETVAVESWAAANSISPLRSALARIRVEFGNATAEKAIAADAARNAAWTEGA